MSFRGTMLHQFWTGHIWGLIWLRNLQIRGNWNCSP
jgi:hypothetical protein